MADPEHIGDAADEVEEMEEEEEQTGVDGFAEQVLRRPDVLAALQGRLHAEMLEVTILQVNFCFAQMLKIITMHKYKHRFCAL